MQKGFLLSVTVGMWVIAGSSFAWDKGVYGDDDRRDVFHQDNDGLMQILARSTAAVIDVRAMSSESSEGFQLDARTHGEQIGLCENERFHNQPAAAVCSSFLVAPDIMISAGHCFMGPRDCESQAFVFDYAYYTENDQPERVDASSVYYCAEVLKIGLDDDIGLDYAIVKLNRPVEDRNPLPVAPHSNLARGDSVTVIGNPSGLPTKIAGGAEVRSSADPVWFNTNLDTFEGNSGSAVFNSANGDVEGILVRGDIDFEYDEEQGCQRVKRCANDGCQGEAVTKISAFYEELSPYLASMKKPL